jgi:SHS2 domain-containing protein
VDRFEVFEHTADVGIRAYGPTVDELFANAAAGMFSLITDLEAVRSVGTFRVEVASPDLPALLVDWLSELLFVHETEDVLLAEFHVAVEDTRLKATARGEAIDRERHPLHMNVKAVTFHELVVNPEEGYAQVIFDI